jgi:predicted nucleotidyltransferase
MTNHEKIVVKIKELVKTTIPDSDIYLYGSRARGNNKSHSDWDLLILLDQTNLSFVFETKVMDAFYDLELETGEVISPLIYTKQDWIDNHSFTPLFENVQKEGKKIV